MGRRSTTEAELRRISLLLLALVWPFTSVIPAIAQEDGFSNPLEIILDALDTPEGRLISAQFSRQPTPERGAITDPRGDFEHSTGQDPGYTPDHLDITDAWAFQLDTRGVDLFAPTDASQLWAPTGRREVDPGTSDPFHTFTGDRIHDGSQYEDGALLFGFGLVSTPPLESPGRCEYVVWINDTERGSTFVNDPNFPRDPAGGTNVAFGLGLNPDGGPGIQSGFTLDLQETGGFAADFETDVRAFVTPRYVGIAVPRGQVGQMEAINFYTFCVEEGFGFEPENTGADQTGLIDVDFEDLGAVAIRTGAPPVSATTTTTPTTTSTSTSTSTSTTNQPESDPVAVEEEPSEEEFPWWFLLVGGGLGLAVLGWWLYASKADRCKDVLEAWVSAQKLCDETQHVADEAAEACDELELELQTLEDERDEICRVWPPASWSTPEGDWIEDQDGNRITSRDIHMRKVALGDTWARYRAGELTAGQVEAEWRLMDTPEFRQEMRETHEVFTNLLEEIEDDLSRTRGSLDEACREAQVARERADENCAAATAAKGDYEECVGHAVRRGRGTDEENSEAQGWALAGESVSDPHAPCQGEESKRKYESAGEAHYTRVFVDFSVTFGVSVGAERPVDAGQRFVVELSDLATELDFMGSLLDARSAGLHVPGAVNGYQQGRYVTTRSGVFQGGIDTLITASDSVPDEPTAPAQAGIDGLETLTRLGAVIAGKLSEWMKGVQLMTVRLTMFYQDIAAIPYTVWECQEGRGWVCLEKVWEIDVGKLKRRQGRDRVYTINSEVGRREFKRLIRGLSRRAASTIKQDAEALAAWRVDHEAGPCP